MDLKTNIDQLLGRDFEVAAELREAASTNIADVILTLRFQSQADAQREISLTSSLLSPDDVIKELNQLPFAQAYSLFVDTLHKRREIPLFRPTKFFDGEKLIALDFFKKYWLSYSKAGFLFRDTLDDYDRKLISTVRVYHYKRSLHDELNALLPLDPYYRYLRIARSASPTSPEFADSTIKIAERLKSRRRDKSFIDAALV
ncbi:MAG: hypothetical protein WDN06_12735 [Asticcacaulis sp.]